MSLQLHFYLPPAKVRGREIMKSFPWMCECVHACMCKWLGKRGLRVTLVFFENKMAVVSHFYVKWASYQKGLKSPSSLVLGVWNEITTHRKSWSANLLQVSNLTFESCFKACRVNILQRRYISLIIGSRASKYENNL